MKMYRFLLATVILFCGVSFAYATQVTFVTNQGDIVIKLYDKRAPVTVKNFLSYVKSGFYNGTTFHRVIDNFMIQGGGFDAQLKQKRTKAPIRNESLNGLSNEVGTVAMARTNNPNSATSQFFINVRDNAFLDAQSGKHGYAVFGKVIQGLDVVMRIAKQKTHSVGHMRDVPVSDIVIKKATVKS